MPFWSAYINFAAAKKDTFIMNILRRILFALYVLIVVCMGTATIVEKYRGTSYVLEHIYGSWWFTLVWAALAVVAVIYFVRRRIRRLSAVLLHLSFVVILTGALLTHLTAVRGMVHLREGALTNSYLVDKGRVGVVEQQLPFSLRLDKFKITYHDGTAAVQDYESLLTVIDGGNKQRATVSMNNILSYRSYRFYQANYDDDGLGSVLQINSDPWGIPVTYTGYGLLFVALLWMLVDPRGAYRQVLRSAAAKKGLLMAALVLSVGSVSAAPVLPRETAEHFGRLNILYNNRICPLQTFAIDFTKKLCGRTTYDGCTAEQVLTGFIFFGDEWCAEPIIKLKGGELRETLQLPRFVAVNTFFNRDMGGYTIGPYVQEYLEGNNDKFHKQVGDVDDRLQLVLNLRMGKLLKVFPCTVKGKTTWYAPADKPGIEVDAGRAQYFTNVFSLLYQDVKAGNYASVDAVVEKMLKYQQQNAGQSLPTVAQVKAERLYNAVPFATILFMLNLTMGFLTLFFAIWRLTRSTALRHVKTVNGVSVAVMLLSFAALTLCLALRWVVSGTVPMANGYETMLFMSWLIMLCSLLLCRRFSVVLTFGFIMSGLFLLVSHIGQMDPQITHVMPVLNSPLLSIHVSVIMIAFALLSLTFICAVMAIVLRLVRGSMADRLGEQLESLQLLSDLFLYPAMVALGFGIFIGAIWANVSWGNYWGWDSKETWGLITFMVYAVSLHRSTLSFLRRPLGYHVFMVLAFMTILMTYFGVNYFLGVGMHSYA